MLEAKLKERGVPCVVIPFYPHGWCTNGKKETIRRQCKNLLKEIVNFTALKKTVRYIKQNHIDLVHINALTDEIGARAAIATKTPFIWHIREFMEEDLGISFCNKTKAQAEMNAAACMIAVSEEVRKKFQPMVSTKIRVVYNGIDAERFYRKREILSRKTVMICMVGRICPPKGQRQLIDAVISLADKGYRNVKVQLIGNIRDEAYADQMKQAIKKSQVPDAFEFVGFTEKVEEYYENADIICVCSTKEAFGRVTVEGMVSGALVIGSNSGGTKELIRDGETGFLYQNDSVSLEKILEQVIREPEKARVIAAQGQVWAYENFTMQKNAESILKIYSEV